jgi:methyltransferase (TIGR00027 family)
MIEVHRHLRARTGRRSAPSLLARLICSGKVSRRFCVTSSPCRFLDTPTKAVAMWASFPHHTSAAWVLRSRYTEDRLAAARVRLNQYVTLGAGLDSYALRHAADLNELIVYEVDDPPMQVWKQARPKALGLETPKQLRFTPCDFERSSIADALADVGFAPQAAAFISWLAVTQYLSPASISDTLRWAAGCAPGRKSSSVS